jgi:hypothetical protein
MPELDAFGFTGRQESHRLPVHQRRLREIEHQSGTVPPELSLELGQVLLAPLEAPPRPDLGVVSWAEWMRAVEDTA